MTRRRLTKGRTPFGSWVCTVDGLDSGLGYRLSDIDYVWWIWGEEDCIPLKFMLIEEKSLSGIAGTDFTITQRRFFRIIDGALKAFNGIDYMGYHILQFENTSPIDGAIFLDYAQISLADFVIFLRFDADKEKYNSVDFWKTLDGKNKCSGIAQK